MQALGGWEVLECGRRARDIALVAEDGGDEVAAVVVVGGVREGFFAGEAGRDLVGAEDVGHFDGVGHRGDAVGIHFRELVDVADDLGELRGHRSEFVLSEPQAAEEGDFFDVLAGDHGLARYAKPPAEPAADGSLQRRRLTKHGSLFRGFGGFVGDFEGSGADDFGDAAGADALGAHEGVLVAAGGRLDFYALQVGLELATADARDLRTDATQVLLLTAGGHLITELRTLATHTALPSHGSPQNHEPMFKYCDRLL